MHQRHLLNTVVSWQAVESATEYQLFTYTADTSHIKMLETAANAAVVMDDLEPGSTHCYIVQPISYVEIADNVSGGNSVGATCGDAPAETVSAISYDMESDSLTLSWQEMEGVETYYIYRYHPDANMLSMPKTVSDKTSLPTVRALPTPRSATSSLQNRCPAGSITTGQVRFPLCSRILKAFISAGRNQTPFY